MCWSDARVQEMGVPQGCILSVTLFSIKINSIVNAINPGVECSLYVDDFVICKIRIHVVTEFKFLGVIFDTKLTFLPHINALKKKCKKALNLLKVVAHSEWGG